MNFKSKSCILGKYAKERRFIMKKIMRTGIAVGIAVISVQIVNPVYAEESETQKHKLYSRSKFG